MATKRWIVSVRLDATHDMTRTEVLAAFARSIDIGRGEEIDIDGLSIKPLTYEGVEPLGGIGGAS